MRMEELIVEYINILAKSMRKSTQQYKADTQSEKLFALTITQLHYLHMIGDMEGVTFKQLAERFNVQKSTVTDTVNRLIGRGIVAKKQSTEDLRVYHIDLTEEGRRLLDMEKEAYLYFAKKMTRCLNDTEKEDFTRLLKKITTEIRD